MLRYSQNRSTKSGASSNKRCKGDLGAASLGSEDEQTVTISQSEHEMGKMAMLLLSQVPLQIENLLRQRLSTMRSALERTSNHL